MTNYAHNYDPPLKYGALIQQSEIEGGGGGVVWKVGKLTGDGVTLIFNLPSTPSANSLDLKLNGQTLVDQAIVAVGYDYSLSAAQITMVNAPLSTDIFTYKYT
jgi:hypothetical protein